MTTPNGLPLVLTRGGALLERSLGFTLGGLQLVTPEAMTRDTPCVAWDLEQLLLHMDRSLLALHEAIAVGHLDLDPETDLNAVYADYGDPRTDPVSALKNRACRLVGDWLGPSRAGTVTVADRSLRAEVVAAAGAVEVTVHGWDVGRACGADRPVPAALAVELLQVCALLVDDDDRPHRFGPPVPVATAAPAGDRLVALLGRAPGWGPAGPAPAR